jgi:nucleoside-triphosphatase THEP1
MVVESVPDGRDRRPFLEAIRSQATDRLFLALRNHDRITFELRQW